MSGIQTETTTDAGGGSNVGWIDANDWMDYSVNVATAGTYNLSFRVASGTTGGQVQLRKGSTVLATANIPGTGGWQTWSTITTTAALTAGTQTFRLHAVTSGFNINYVQFATGGTPPPPPSSSYYLKNRWQNTYLYDAGDRVRYNATRSGTSYQWVLEDVGGGQRELRNVGTGEYMHVENLMGYVQCTSRTPGWGSARWTTEDAGSGFIRIKNAWQNTSYIHVENLAGHAQYGTINTAWMSAQWLLEAVPAGGREISEAITPLAESVMLWPTVVEKELNIQTDGSYHSVEVIDMIGRVHLQQSIEGERSVTLELGNLNAGVHFIKLRGSQKINSLRFIKK
jgi:hypothetical protein